MRDRLDPGVRLAGLAFAWLAGAALQLQQSQLWSAGLYAGLTGGALALALVQRRRWPLLLIALAVLAFGSTGWRAQSRLAEALPSALEGRDLQLTGVIASLPQSDAVGTRFVFAVEQALLGDTPVPVPRRVSLGWYRNAAADALLPAPERELRAGQRWRFSVRLRQPHGSLNPHGFDLELWLFERGIRASGYVRAKGPPDAVRLASASAYPIERLRQHLRDAIAARVPQANAAGLLAALVVGDQGAIARADWDLFRATGIAHLVSISGLHVTMFAWLAAALVGRLWRRSPPLMLRWPTPHAARWGGLALATAYAMLAGWGVPAQRTLWMIAAVVALRSLGLRWPQPLVLLAAAAVVTAIDPWALLQPGFWLSFLAVGLLIGSEPVSRPAAAVTTARERWRALALGGLRTQAVATVGLAPLSLLFFQQVSFIGFVANLLAIPLVTLLLTPLALAGALWPALWTVASAIAQGLTAFLGLLAGWPFGVWTAAAAPAWAAAAGLLGGTLLVLPLPWAIRLLGLPLLLPVLLPPPAWPAPGRFELTAVDVGQGTAVLVRTSAHLLVYDAGPRYSAEADAGERALLPLLRARGEGRIDLLLLSHQDSDHVGGAASLLARFPVAAVTSSLPSGHPLRAEAPAHRPCVAGQRWDWDGVRFEILHPGAELLALPPAKPNALSCVLRIEDAGGVSALLSGDIEAAQEAALVVGRGPALASTMLLVPHHGSRTSSSAAFLDAVAPRVAVVQAAYRSRFGHPAADVVERYLARGIELQRSDRCGAWVWRSDGNASCEREVARRYWHHEGR